MAAACSCSMPTPAPSRACRSGDPPGGRGVSPDALAPDRRHRKRVGAHGPPTVMTTTDADIAALADRIDALLPQTQCRRCLYSACRPYAEAIARGEAPINRCPPGG